MSSIEERFGRRVDNFLKQERVDTSFVGQVRERVLSVLNSKADTELDQIAGDGGLFERTVEAIIADF